MPSIHLVTKLSLKKGVRDVGGGGRGMSAIEPGLNLYGFLFVEVVLVNPPCFVLGNGVLALSRDTLEEQTR